MITCWNHSDILQMRSLTNTQGFVSKEEEGNSAHVISTGKMKHWTTTTPTGRDEEKKEGTKSSCFAIKSLKTLLITSPFKFRPLTAAAQSCTLSLFLSSILNLSLVHVRQVATHRRIGCREPAHYPTPKRACHSGRRPDCYWPTLDTCSAHLQARAKVKQEQPGTAWEGSRWEGGGGETSREEEEKRKEAMLEWKMIKDINT